jgi:hypothetical protein
MQCGSAMGLPVACSDNANPSDESAREYSDINGVQVHMNFKCVS